MKTVIRSESFKLIFSAADPAFRFLFFSSAKDRKETGTRGRMLNMSCIQGRRTPVVILEEAAFRQASDRTPTPVQFPPTPEKSPDASLRTNNPYAVSPKASKCSTPIPLLAQPHLPPIHVGPPVLRGQPCVSVQVGTCSKPPSPRDLPPIAAETPLPVLVPTAECLERISKLLSTMEVVLCAVTGAFHTHLVFPQPSAADGAISEARDRLFNIVVMPPTKPAVTIGGVRLSTMKQQNLITVLLWRLQQEQAENFGCLFLCAYHPHVFWSSLMLFHTTGTTTNVDLDEDIVSIQTSSVFRCMYGKKCGIPLCPCRHTPSG